MRLAYDAITFVVLMVGMYQIVFWASSFAGLPS